MSRKPDDIPQGIWDEAWKVYFKRCDDAEKLAENFEEHEVLDLVARALLAERERCAALLNNGCTLEDGEPVDPAIPDIYHAINEGVQP